MEQAWQVEHGITTALINTLIHMFEIIDYVAIVMGMMLP